MKRPIALKFACSEDWSSFVGDERRRLCQRCERHVHHLSTMTRTEAADLFRCPPEEGLCVRYQHDGQGRILFRSERYPGHMAWKRFVMPSRSDEEPERG